MGKFVVAQAKTGIKFNLLDDKGDILASSQIYKTLKTALAGVDSVKANTAEAPIEDQTAEGYKAEKCPKFEVYADKAGKPRFRLKAKNGQIIAVGEGYESMKACLDEIAAIKANAPEAAVEQEA